MKKGDLFFGGTRELNKARIEGTDSAFCKVFEEASEGDKMVALGEGGKSFMILIIVETVKAEAEFAKYFWCEIGWSDGGTFRKIWGNKF